MEDYKKLSANGKTVFWQSHIKKWKESGSSQAMYCRQNGLNKNAFTWRKRNLEGKTRTRMTKVPGQAVNKINHVQPAIELTVNGRLRITVGQDFDPGLLQRLLKALGAYDDSRLV